jgi:hypothetical protein
MKSGVLQKRPNYFLDDVRRIGKMTLPALQSLNAGSVIFIAPIFWRLERFH